MKMFKCVASRRGEKRPKKNVKKQVFYESRSFTFEAVDFKQAVVVAEKIAKKIMLFEALKVSEV